jgi:hypothetical protein
VVVRFVDALREPAAVELDGVRLQRVALAGAEGQGLWSYDAERRTVIVRIEESPEERRVRVLYGG